MSISIMSEKGQFTIPAWIRKKFNLAPSSPISVEVSGDRIVLRPVKSADSLHGVFNKYASSPVPDWEDVRGSVQQKIAREVADEGR